VGEGDEPGTGCLLGPEACEAEPGSLDDVLNSILKAPHNNDLTATMTFTNPESGRVTVDKSKTERQPFTVRGEKTVLVQVRP
jgi:hypothetical protein